MKKKRLFIPLFTIPVLLLTACSNKTENGIAITNTSEHCTPLTTVTQKDNPDREEVTTTLYEFDKNLPNRPNVWNALQKLYDNADDKVNGFPVYYRNYVSNDNVADIYTNYILLPDYQAVYVRAKADYTDYEQTANPTDSKWEPNGYYTLCFRSYNDKFTYNGEKAFNLELPIYLHHYLVSDFFNSVRYYNNGILAVDLSEKIATDKDESFVIYISPQTNALKALQNDEISEAKNCYIHWKTKNNVTTYEIGVIKDHTAVTLESDVPYYKIRRIDSLLLDNNNTTPVEMQPIVHEVIKQNSEKKSCSVEKTLKTLIKANKTMLDIKPINKTTLGL